MSQEAGTSQTDHGPVARWWAALARRSVRGRNDLVLGVLDSALVVAAYLVMLLARYDTAVPDDAWTGLWTFVPLAIGVHLAANFVAGLYGPVWEQASILEAQRLLAAGGSATVVLTASLLLLPRHVPLSVALIGGGIATGLFGVLRFQSRLFAFRRRAGAGEVNVLVVGAGESAGALLREFGRRDDASVRPLALLDDDPRKHGRRLAGVPIVGTIDDLVHVGETLEVDEVLLAIPSATSALVRRVADAAAELGVRMKVLPGVTELVNGQPQLRDVRDLSIDDLLGRQQVSTDLQSVRALVEGRRVLVTGGGGSIGAEIARQVARYEPARLVLLDRDETHLFEAASAVDGVCRQALVDIRDLELVRRVFADEQPEIVFHAAAHKHVPLLESHPCEAAATNVLGTEHVVTAAREAGVGRLVFVSTDKAVRPSSVMGASKRVGEQLVLTAAPDDTAWCAVRFGNVLGSRGSVVPTFMSQIRRGGPVSLTHPQMTRYFMSIPEAVQLVLQAAALASGREVFMLDMGEPVRIIDLANRMISLAGYRPGVDVRIEITGLRPGEKLAEELNTEDEDPQPTAHPKILRLCPPLPDAGLVASTVERLRNSVARRDDQVARELLFEFARRDGTTIIHLPEAGPGANAPVTTGDVRTG